MSRSAAARGREGTGFTLIEVLATMLLLAIVLPAVMGGISSALRAVNTSRRHLEAATLAESKLAELGMAPLVAQGSSSGDFGSDYPGFRWTSLVMTREESLLEVTVIVTWDDKGLERALTMSTLVYSGGDFVSKDAAGFTLIEILLALLMTSILMLALGGTLSTAFKARDTALAKAAETRGVHTALEILRRDLESALPPSGILAGPFVALPSAGASHSLQLHCVRRSGGPLSSAGLAGGMAAGGLQAAGFMGMARVEIGVQKSQDSDDTTPALVRQVTRNLLAPVVAPPVSEVLCRRVRSFRCRFFDGLQWLETWDSTTQGNVLPAAVEVELEIETPAFKGYQPTTYRARRLYRLSCHTEAAATASATGQQTGGGQ